MATAQDPPAGRPVVRPPVRPAAAEREPLQAEQMVEAEGLPDRMPPVPDRAMAAEIEAMRAERLQAVRVSESVLTEVAALDDPSFERREAASDRLRSRAIQDAEIWAVLDRGGLAPESHERLLEVACRRALERPRGALGVRMGSSPPNRPGIIVQATIPGLPADRVLLPGDLVRRIDGQPMIRSSDMVAVLQMHPPGHEVLLEVVRNQRDAANRVLVGPEGQPLERVMEFRVALGDADLLDQADPVAPGMLRNTNPVMQQRRMLVRVIQERFAAPEPVLVRPAERTDGD
jgi:hypothetical protein